MIKRFALLLTSLAAVSVAIPRSGLAQVGSAYTLAFDEFWKDFDRTYSYFEYKQVDWPAVRTNVRDRAAAAESDSAFVALLIEAVQPMRDVHIWFRRPDDTLIPSYRQPRARNWNRAVWNDYMQRWNFSQQPGWGYTIIDSVGYLAIAGWNSEQIKIEDIDKALDRMRGTRAMILDVRMNGGGNDALAMQVAARFTASSFTYGNVQFRNGAAHNAFGKPIDRELKPRGPWTYTQPVYLLIGRGCYSSNETFIAAMSMLKNVTVAGDTTGASTGNPIERPIMVGKRNTGWRYSVPRWIERTANGTVIEWNGIAPAVVIPFDTTGRKDSVLEWALQQARGVGSTRR